MSVDRLRSPASTSKRTLHDGLESGPPLKKRKALLEDEDSTKEDSSISNELGGAIVNQSGGSSEEGGFKVNEEYAKRFEYNKKREELGRCRESPFLSEFTKAHLNSAGEISIFSNTNAQR